MGYNRPGTYGHLITQITKTDDGHTCTTGASSKYDENSSILMVADIRTNLRSSLDCSKCFKSPSKKSV